MILLATDGSREADLALTAATDLAKNTGSELHLTTVSSEVLDFAYIIRKHLSQDAEEALRAFEQEPRRLLEELREIEQAGGRSGRST
jgi:nucleotide-binding universal stress UspA family protein